MRQEIQTMMDDQIASITNTLTVLDLVVGTSETSLEETFTYQNGTRFTCTNSTDGYQYEVFANEALDYIGSVIVNVSVPISEMEMRNVATLSIGMDGHYNESYQDIPKTVRRKIFAYFSDVEDAVDSYINNDDYTTNEE
jgi:hypothetical protein